MTGNQTMDYYVWPRHLYLHSRTCTCSKLCRRLSYWWHSRYATSLIVPVFMRFHLSWLDSSIFQTFPALMEILIYYIFSHYGYHGPLYVFIMEILVYVYSTWRWPLMWYLVSCLFIAIVLLCIWDCYMYLQYVQSCIIVLCWLGGWSSIWDSSSLHFWDGIIMYFGHRMTPLTSHIRGHLL